MFMGPCCVRVRASGRFATEYNDISTWYYDTQHDIGNMENVIKLHERASYLRAWLCMRKQKLLKS